MNRCDKFEQIRIIADAICEKEVQTEQITTLDTLLLGDSDAQQFYYDYIEMHTRMQAEAGPSMEVVRRRLMVDEVIFRPSNQQVSGSTAIETIVESMVKPISESVATPNAMKYTPTRGIPIKWLTIVILLTSLTVVLFAWLFFNVDKQGQVAELANEDALRIEGLGKIEAHLVYPGVYSAIKPTTLTLLSGEQLTLAKHTLIKLYNTTEIELMSGQLSLEPVTGKNLIVHTETFSVHSGGGKINIDLTAQQPTVIASGNALLLPKRWRPNHYWPFENNSDRVVDYAGNAYGIAGLGTAKVNGLVGRGAFLFDASADARINVGSGGGTAPATGTFSVVDGVTIEALVKPQFKGQYNNKEFIPEQDQIFRKDQTDQEHRMLLSIKKIRPDDPDLAAGLKGNAIAFGMYLIGQGYHTLYLPLDGKQGRPTLNQLKDGKPHHIVGSYDVSSGLKAIFIDGKRLASYQYPLGTKMISGGTGVANIGNNPNRTDGTEAYGGIIDEVAFYDFALTEYMVKQHYQAAMAGNNYFNIDLADQKLPLNIRLPLPANKRVTLDPLTGLISSTVALND